MHPYPASPARYSDRSPEQPSSPHPSSAVKHAGTSDWLTMPASTTGLGMDIAKEVMTLEGRSADTCPTSTASKRTCSFGPNSRRRTKRSKRGSRAPLCSRAANRCCWWACRDRRGQSQQQTLQLGCQLQVTGQVHSWEAATALHQCRPAARGGPAARASVAVEG